MQHDPGTSFSAAKLQHRGNNFHRHRRRNDTNHPAPDYFVNYQFLPKTGKESSNHAHRRHQESKQRPTKPFKVPA